MNRISCLIFSASYTCQSGEVLEPGTMVIADTRCLKAIVARHK